jgi:drug/metabolite transporter (DMT)-like permease
MRRRERALASPASHPLSRPAAAALFAVVVITWSINWAVTKTLVATVPPLWTTAIRSAIAAVALLVLLLACRQLILPRRGDVPVILSVSLLHMVGFSALVAFGLQHAPVGRGIVIGYATPLWVAPGAWLLLGEALPRARLIGIGLGLAGLAIMLNPLALDWSDGAALTGHGLIALASLCWAASILHVRAHVWISTPFQLVFWQALLAAAVMSPLALATEGLPAVALSPRLVAAFLFAGLFGTALAYWAMTMVNRALPAAATSLGTLATPVIGVAIAAGVMAEPVGASLVAAMALILGGIAIAAIPGSLRS